VIARMLKYFAILLMMHESPT